MLAFLRGRLPGEDDRHVGGHGVLVVKEGQRPLDGRAVLRVCGHRAVNDGRQLLDKLDAELLVVHQRVELEVGVDGFAGLDHLAGVLGAEAVGLDIAPEVVNDVPDQVLVLQRQLRDLLGPADVVELEGLRVLPPAVVPGGLGVRHEVDPDGDAGLARERQELVQVFPVVGVVPDQPHIRVGAQLGQALHHQFDVNLLPTGHPQLGVVVAEERDLSPDAGSAKEHRCADKQYDLHGRPPRA